jgi:hypothetical protein
MWDFITNASVDSIDAVPDEHQSYYEEDKATKKFVLKADVRPLAEGYSNANRNVAKLTLTRKEDGKKDQTRRLVIDGLKAILPELGVELEGDDITKIPEIMKEKITELVESGKSGKDNKVNIENVKKAMETQITKLKETHAQELGAMSRSIEEYLVDSVANAAFAKAGTVDNGSDLLLPKVRASVKVIRTDDGKYVPRVIDEDGTYKFNSKGTEMSVEELVGDLKTKFPNMFKSENKGGGGSTKSGSNRTLDRSTEKTSVDKIASGLGGLGK